MSYKLLKKILGKKQPAFPGSTAYWEQRYAQGRDSGIGSYHQFAEFKAEIINDFVCAQKVQSVIEFGCGDGNQLLLADYPVYLGVDVSPTIITMCKDKFLSDTTKSFMLLDEYQNESAELSLSLDVLYHLVEDSVFENYMQTLFEAATRYVIIYSSNIDSKTKRPHVKHRQFTDWVESNATSWKILEHIKNKYPYDEDYKTGSFADFYIYMKKVAE